MEKHNVEHNPLMQELELKIGDVEVYYSWVKYRENTPIKNLKNPTKNNTHIISKIEKSRIINELIWITVEPKQEAEQKELLTR